MLLVLALALFQAPPPSHPANAATQSAGIEAAVARQADSAGSEQKPAADNRPSDKEKPSKPEPPDQDSPAHADARVLTVASGSAAAPSFSYLPGHVQPVFAPAPSGFSALPLRRTDVNSVPLADSALAFRAQMERRRPMRLWYTLAVVQHSAATFDAWSTRRAIESGNGHEVNPLLRPFAGSGALYVAIQAGPSLLDYVGRRMMTNRRSWVRRIWWLPQVAGTVMSLASGAHNLGVADRATTP